MALAVTALATRGKAYRLVNAAPDARVDKAAISDILETCILKIVISMKLSKYVNGLLVAVSVFINHVDLTRTRVGFKKHHTHTVTVN